MNVEIEFTEISTNLPFMKKLSKTYQQGLLRRAELTKKHLKKIENDLKTCELALAAIEDDTSRVQMYSQYKAVIDDYLYYKKIVRNIDSYTANP